MDVDYEMKTHGIHPGVGAFMVAGLGGGQIIALLATVVTYFIMRKMRILGRIIVLFLHIGLTVYFIISVMS
jgi:hypothetical protein